MLTLKEFREITKDLDENIKINTTVNFGDENSIRGTINVVQICEIPHTYSKESYIVLTQNKQQNLQVKKLVGKNLWENVNE